MRINANGIVDNLGAVVVSLRTGFGSLDDTGGCQAYMPGMNK